MWVRTERDDNWMGLVDFSNARYSHADAIDLRLNGLIDQITPTDSTHFYSSGACIAVTEPLRFPLHTWTHVAVMQDVSSAAIYWKTTLKVSAGALLPPAMAHTYNFIRNSAWDDSFVGEPRDVLVFNHGRGGEARSGGRLRAAASVAGGQGEQDVRRWRCGALARVALCSPAAAAAGAAPRLRARADDERRGGRRGRVVGGAPAAELTAPHADAARGGVHHVHI